MLHCFTSSFWQSSSNPRRNHCLPSQDNTVGNTPRSNALSSPGVNPSLEFAKSVHTPSYNEIWNKIRVVEECENGDANQFLADVLQPNHECVREILQHASTNPFTQQLSTYFSHTEQICHLLLILNRGIYRTCSVYIPIQKLIDVLPGSRDSLNQAQCNWAYDIFLQFENMENPFPGSHSYNCMHRCFSDLKEQVDGCLHKSQPRVCTGSATCHIGAAVGVAITAVSAAAHALAALVAGSSFPPAPKLTQKDLAHIALLDAAARSAYVLHNDLQTIDRLACLLQTAVEGDRFFIRIGIARGRENYPISEVVKRLAKSHPNIRALLTDLEEHICLCFTAINRARFLLLQEIQLHQSL